jgi:hypothetical protein
MHEWGSGYSLEKSTLTELFFCHASSHTHRPPRAQRVQSLEDGRQGELAKTALVVRRTLGISNAEAALFTLKDDRST